MNEFKMDSPEQEPDWSVRMREVHSDQLKRVRAEARALIEQMREAARAVLITRETDHPMRTADFHNLDCPCSRCQFDRLKEALTAATEWLRVNK